jgi:D-aspartate ligase
VIKPEQKGPDRPVAVVIGVGDSNGCGIIRSLGRCGIPVIGLDPSRMAVGLVSRYCRGRRCPDPQKGSEESFIRFLLDIGQRQTSKAVLFPLREDLEVIVLKHRERLEKYYRFTLSSLDTVEKIMDKEKFYRLLENTDIPFPKTYYANSEDEIEKISAKMAYPCIVKPTRSMEFGKAFGVKVFVANSSQELRQAINQATRRGFQVVIQELIPGRDSDLYVFTGYYDHNSNLAAAFTFAKVRQYPTGFGVGTLCRSVGVPEIVENTTKFLHMIKYSGIVDADYKRDARDGRFMLIEINARPGNQNALATRCGVNLPYVAYMDAIGQGVAIPVADKREVKWLSLINDLRSASNGLFKRQLTLRDWVRSLQGEMVFAVFAWDDPLPFLMQLVNLTPGLGRFILRPIRRAFSPQANR